MTKKLPKMWERNLGWAEHPLSKYILATHIFIILHINKKECQTSFFGLVNDTAVALQACRWRYGIRELISLTSFSLCSCASLTSAYWVRSWSPAKWFLQCKCRRWLRFVFTNPSFKMCITRFKRRMASIFPSFCQSGLWCFDVC